MMPKKKGIPTLLNGESGAIEVLFGYSPGYAFQQTKDADNGTLCLGGLFGQYSGYVRVQLTMIVA